MIKEITTTAEVMPDTYKAAVELHCQVMISKEQVEIALCKFAMHLKAMRDGKVYLQLNYDSFDDYVEKAVNINTRQVYNYISAYEKLGSDVMQSNAKLGISKLLLVASVPDTDRADFIANNDLEGMSVKEIKELIEQSKQQVEQISLLNITVENQKADLEQVNIDEQSKEELQDELDTAKMALVDLQSKPIEVAVAEVSDADIAKIKADAETAIKADYEAKQKQFIKDATEKAVEKAQKDMQKQIEDAKVQAATDTAEQYKKSISNMESEKALAVEKADKLAKELQVAVDGDMTTIQFYLDELTSLFGKITQKVGEIDKKDKAKAQKISGAVARILNVLQEQVKEG